MNVYVLLLFLLFHIHTCSVLSDKHQTCLSWVHATSPLHSTMRFRQIPNLSIVHGESRLQLKKNMWQLVQPAFTLLFVFLPSPWSFHYVYKLGSVALSRQPTFDPMYHQSGQHNQQHWPAQSSSCRQPTTVQPLWQPKPWSGPAVAEVAAFMAQPTPVTQTPPQLKTSQGPNSNSNMSPRDRAPSTPATVRHNTHRLPHRV